MSIKRHPPTSTLNWLRCGGTRTLLLLVGVWNGTTSLENSLGVSYKVKEMLSMGPTIPFLGIYPREMTHKKTMSIKRLHTNINSDLVCHVHEMETIQMSINRWTDKLWCISIMEYYTATRRNELLIHATEMNLKIGWMEEARPKVV